MDFTQQELDMLQTLIGKIDQRLPDACAAEKARVMANKVSCELGSRIQLVVPADKVYLASLAFLAVGAFLERYYPEIVDELINEEAFIGLNGVMDAAERTAALVKYGMDHWSGPKITVVPGAFTGEEWEGALEI